MTWYAAVLLGCVQGFAEFLPISSSGHLLLLAHWLGVESGLLLTIVLHLATLAAVLVVYWRQIVKMVGRPGQMRNWLLVVATAITCLLVVGLQKPLTQGFSERWLPFLFIFTGVYLCQPWLWRPRVRLQNLYSLETLKNASTREPPARTAWWAAVAVGCAQGLAVLPGLSRSGLTVTTGQLCGMDTQSAVDFSFLLSIPIIVASLVFELARGGSLGNVSALNLVLACVSAFVCGLLAIKWMLKLSRQLHLGFFAVYLLILGGSLLLRQGWSGFSCSF